MRILALNLLATIAKVGFSEHGDEVHLLSFITHRQTSPKLIYPFWPLLFPDIAMQLVLDVRSETKSEEQFQMALRKTSCLYSFLLSDTSSLKLKVASLQTMSSLVDGSRSYLAIASERYLSVCVVERPVTSCNILIAPKYPRSSRYRRNWVSCWCRCTMSC